MQIEQAINSGKSNIFKPRKTLSKAFLKVKPNRSQKKEVKGIRLSFLEQPAANTFSLEEEIDQLVYLLYGLNEEEIEIIETS